MNEALVYLIYDLNSYISYCAGISFYIAYKMIYSACTNRKITCGQKQFTDFLVLRQKEARWAGFQIMLLYLNLISIWFAGLYNNYQNTGYSYTYVTGALWLQLGSQVLKILAFQPLNKSIIPVEEE